jgi:hypothetical protein
MSKELKVLVWLFVIAIVSMVGHNLFEAIGFDILSVVLFFLTLISALVFFVGIVFVGVECLMGRGPWDAWKVGFVGVGLVGFGLVVGMNSIWFYVFGCILILFFVRRVVVRKEVKK